jgi:hypothetical protein
VGAGVVAKPFKRLVDGEPLAFAAVGVCGRGCDRLGVGTSACADAGGECPTARSIGLSRTVVGALRAEVHRVPTARGGMTQQAMAASGLERLSPFAPRARYASRSG